LAWVFDFDRRLANKTKVWEGKFPKECKDLKMALAAGIIFIVWTYLAFLATV
jgi:hypothetical protein